MPNAEPWTPAEDATLCKAYNNISDDDATSTDQRSSLFCERICETNTGLAPAGTSARKEGALTKEEQLNANAMHEYEKGLKAGTAKVKTPRETRASPSPSLLQGSLTERTLHARRALAAIYTRFLYTVVDEGSDNSEIDSCASSAGLGNASRIMGGDGTVETSEGTPWVALQRSLLTWERLAQELLLLQARTASWTAEENQEVCETYASYIFESELRAAPRSLEMDAREQSRHSSKTVSSYRPGGEDLRVVCANKDERSAKSAGSGTKHPYRTNRALTPPCTQATSVLEQARGSTRCESFDVSESSNVESGTRENGSIVSRSSCASLDGEYVERRAEAEDRRRREDQEEVLAAERFECREGKHIRCETADAVEVVYDTKKDLLWTETKCVNDMKRWCCSYQLYNEEEETKTERVHVQEGVIS
ncbi:hypothetical protein GQ600_1733 [Phytophthora cactorum]|nr:hypothetical protein GQ600_1733 [Phytophthora cactorum]